MVVDNWLVTGMVWVAGLCSWTATAVSLAAIWAHCKNYSQPNLQRWVVRIIVMVPIYALTAWATLISVGSAYYLDALRDIYEAFVIYCFVSLLISYFGGERAFMLAMHDRSPTPLFWPASLVRKELDLSDPYDYLFLKRSILQYVVVKPTLAASTMLMKSLGVYHDGNWSFSDGYMWTQLVYNASVSLSLYCLVVFYMATRESLARWNPLPKFLCVKAIVFFSYWQGLAISIMVGAGLIHDTPTLSADHIATFLQSWLICLEMIGGAFGHWVSFSYLDYVPTFRLAGRVRLFYAVRDALGFKDVVIDAKNAWSGHRYTYKHFDPAVPVDELDMHLPPSTEYGSERVVILDVETPSSLSSSERAESPLRFGSSRSADATQLVDADSTSLIATFTDQPASVLGDQSFLGAYDSDRALPTSGTLSSNSNAIKERRLRAGMRYTQGGKKTYWLPVDPVDYRATAFAAGGSGRTRASLFHGAHNSTGLKMSAEYIGSTIHSSSRAMHESRRNHKHRSAEASKAQATSGLSPSTSLRPATEHTHLLYQSVASHDGNHSSADPLAVLSMELGQDELALDEAIYGEARGIEGDFNYPVIEVGVAFGYARRMPYGNTFLRQHSTSANAAASTPGPRPTVDQSFYNPL